MEEKNTKICKHCKEKIAKSAKRCPKCGGKLEIPGWAKALIIITIIFVCIIGCVNSCSNAVDEEFGGYDDQKGTLSFKVGETFESKHLKIKFDSVNLNFTGYNEYSTIKQGYKIVQFKFTAENIGEEEQTFDYTDFNCYADDKAMQQFYGAEDSGLDSGGTISHGKKASTSLYCEVPKDASSITAEFKPILADNNYMFIAK